MGWMGWISGWSQVQSTYGANNQFYIKLCATVALTFSVSQKNERVIEDVSTDTNAAIGNGIAVIVTNGSWVEWQQQLLQHPGVDQSETKCAKCLASPSTGWILVWFPSLMSGMFLELMSDHSKGCATFFWLPLVKYKGKSSQIYNML